MNDQTQNIISVREIHGSVDSSYRLAQSLAFGASGRNDAAEASAAFAKMVNGAEMGIAPGAAQRAFHVVKGKIGMSADAMVGVARKHGWKFDIEHSDPPGKSCKVGARKDDEAYSFTYTMDMAKAAGLVRSGSPWVTAPWDMLYARAASHVCRKVASDKLLGIYDPSEIGFETPIAPHAAPAKDEPEPGETRVMDMRAGRKKVANEAAVQDEEEAKVVTPLSHLGLTPGLLGVLEENKVTTLEEVLEKGQDAIAAMRGMGPSRIKELGEAVKAFLLREEGEVVEAA